MFSKFIRILGNFFKSARFAELLEVIALPLIATLIIRFIFKIPPQKLPDFINDFNNSILTIVSLLAAFGVASITLIFSSSSPNIEKAKSFVTDRKDINNLPINYHQLILIRNYYALIMQISLIIVSVFIKVILPFWNNINILYVELFLITHVVLMQLMVITSMFHLMWKDK